LIFWNDFDAAGKTDEVSLAWLAIALPFVYMGVGRFFLEVPFVGYSTYN
jgi:hypothetical protein